MDANTDTPIKSKDGKTIEIADQNKKNAYRIELNEKDKATLFKNDKKLLEFNVKKEEGEKGTNLYASKIESRFYKIRNTLIFTNPTQELGIDLRYASQDKTDDHADNITLEGMHTLT